MARCPIFHLRRIVVRFLAHEAQLQVIILDIATTPGGFGWRSALAALPIFSAPPVLRHHARVRPRRLERNHVLANTIPPESQY